MPVYCRSCRFAGFTSISRDQYVSQHGSMVMKTCNMTPMARPRIGTRILAATLVVAGSFAACIAIRYKLAQAHILPLSLTAKIDVHQGSIGIPGITKLYEATVTNTGLLPAVVERCSYTSDTNTAGTMVAYNIERWNASTGSWSLAFEFAKPSFCTPAPLSMGNTHWGHVLLWPGQSLSTQEEATAARGFKKGDTLRFVIVTEVSGETKHSYTYPTPPIVVDEQMLDNETPYRVAH